MMSFTDEESLLVTYNSTWNDDAHNNNNNYNNLTIFSNLLHSTENKFIHLHKYSAQKVAMSV